MLYVIATLAEGSSWSLVARLYMRALATADYPFRLIWTAHCASTREYDPEDVPDDAPEGGLLHSFGDIFDPTQLPPSLRVLRPFIGPGLSPKPASAMLFIGEVDDAAARISHPEDCPERNIVLTSCPTGALPPHRAAQLNGYDLVLVPEGEGKTFRDALLPNVVEVPWPEPFPGDSRVPVPRPPPTVKRLLLAAGRWAGADRVQHIADAFVQGFRKSDGVGLILACPDVPNTWIATVASTCASKDQLPLIHVVVPSSEDPTWLDPWALAAHAFVDASAHSNSTFCRQRAASLGCPVIDVTEDAQELPPVVSPSGIMPVRQQRALADNLTTIRRMQSQQDVTRASPAQPANPTGRVVADYVARVIAGESFIKATVPPPAERDGIGVVIPFAPAGANISQLASCLHALRAAMRPQDRVVVAARGDADLALSPCVAYDAALVQSTSGGAHWNISAARNAGWRWLAENTNCESIAFVDVDVIVPADYLKRLSREIYKRPGMVLTPYVVDRGADVTTSARIASGMSCYPIDELNAVGGFPEDFVGWGHEDIALLTVLRERRGIPAVALANAPVGIHEPHAPRAGATHKREANENLARLAEVQRRIELDENVVFNVDGPFGTYRVLFTPEG